MQSLGLKQSHFLIDVRLSLGFAAYIIARLTFCYDFQLGFEKTKHYTLYTVVAYFVLNSILILRIWGVEGRCVYVGSKGAVKVWGRAQCSARARTRVGVGVGVGVAAEFQSGWDNLLTADPKVTPSTSTEKYKPEYILVLKPTKGNNPADVSTVKNPFTRWLDQQGFFVAKPFHAFLENSIPVLTKNTAEA